MATYIIIDTQNFFLRVRFGLRAPDLETQIGLVHAQSTFVIV